MRAWQSGSQRSMTAYRWVAGWHGPRVTVVGAVLQWGSAVAWGPGGGWHLGGGWQGAALLLTQRGAAPALSTPPTQSRSKSSHASQHCCGPQEIGGNSAEARASKILHGLGFTEVMQKRATNSFRRAAPNPAACSVDSLFIADRSCLHGSLIFTHPPALCPPLSTPSPY